MHTFQGQSPSDEDDVVKFFQNASTEQLRELHKKTRERIIAEDGEIEEVKNWFPSNES
jgi:hypothetical protein